MKRNLGLMSRGHNMLSKHGLKNVYYAHIYSHMSYCIAVWGSMISCELLNKLRSQQNCCVRMIDAQIPVLEVYKKYKIMSLDNIIDLELCKLWYKLTNNCLPSNLLVSLKGDARGKPLEKKHKYNTRNKNELNLPKVVNNKYHKSFLFQGIKCYSVLPHNLKDCTTYETFVTRLKQHFFKL